MTQREQLINLFITHPNQWLSLPEIMDVAGAQYNARIHELRCGYRCKPMNIKNKTANNIIAGVTIKNSWYMYVQEEKQLEF
jgi:hypothetical protein